MVGKLEPEFILPVGRPSLDGAISETHLFVLTDTSVLKYDKNSRMSLSAIELPIEKEPGSRPLGIVLFEERIIATCRDGRIFLAGADLQRVEEKANLKTSPGFCKPVIFNDTFVFVSCGAAESENFIFLSPRNLEKIKSIEVANRKQFGIPLVMEAKNEELFCAFESGDFLVINKSLNIARIVDSKSQLMSACVSVQDQKHVFYIGEAGGKIIKDGERKREWQMIEASPVCMETRADGKLVAVGFSTGQVALLTCKSLKPLSVLATHKQQISRIIWDDFVFYVFAADCLVSCYKPFSY